MQMTIRYRSLHFDILKEERQNADNYKRFKVCILKHPIRKVKMQICYTKFKVHAEAEIAVQGPSEMELMF